MLFIPERRHQTELLDELQVTQSELKGSLLDLRAVNRFLGGYRLTIQALSRMLQYKSIPEPVRLLDVATGAADTPIEIAKWAQHKGIQLEITGIDSSLRILQISQDWVKSYPEIRLQQADARNLPFPDNLFHICLCSLTLHHFEPLEIQKVIEEMLRVCRVGILINDLERAWPAYLWILLLSHLFSKNRLTHHDGPLSVLRAYRLEELAEIVKPILSNYQITREPFYRLELVAYK